MSSNLKHLIRDIKVQLGGKLEIGLGLEKQRATLKENRWSRVETWLLDVRVSVLVSMC